MMSSNDYSLVDLHRSSTNHSFGFSIRGGQEFAIPLYILKVAEDGPAAQDGRMQVRMPSNALLFPLHLDSVFQSGDQIIEINGHAAHGMTHADAIGLIRSSGLHVRLLLKKTHAPPPSLDGNGGARLLHWSFSSVL